MKNKLHLLLLPVLILFGGCDPTELLPIDQVLGSGNCLVAYETNVENTTGALFHLDVYGADSLFYYRRNQKEQYTDYSVFTYNSKGMPTKVEQFNSNRQLTSYRVIDYWVDGITQKRVRYYNVRIEEDLVYDITFDSFGNRLKYESGGSEIVYTNTYDEETDVFIRQDIKESFVEKYVLFEYYENGLLKNENYYVKGVGEEATYEKLTEYEYDGNGNMVSKASFLVGSDGERTSLLGGQFDYYSGAVFLGREYFNTSGITTVYEVKTGCPVDQQATDE
ncbi:hypothetical protein V6R21_17395 [Limibacter armeniacum]|uniref:hypothetical protein n=1 Tax=Limibacter armeniacum TaxID=466084 RepID=UPI002FE67A82